MKIFQVVFLFFLFIFGAQVISAQQLKENEVVVINEEKYILHQVRTGETLFSISRDFKIDRSVILKNNPQAEEGLNIGEVIKIPYREDITVIQKTDLKKGDPTRFDYHTIESRSETPYFIAKEYGVTVEEIYAYNPEITKFKKGIRIRIPRWDGAAAISENTSPVSADSKENLQEHRVFPGETLYSLAKRYNVSESEILKYNPDAKNLKAGAKIYIPLTTVATEVQATSVSKKTTGEDIVNYFEHIIESGETMWRITRKYGISEAELIAVNPFLTDGFPAGAVIKIPVKNVKPGVRVEVAEESAPEKDAFENTQVVNNEEQISPDYYKVEMPTSKPVVVPESCKPQQTNWFSTSTFNVALFLPLFLEANDTLNKSAELTEIDTLDLELNDVADTDTIIEEEKSEDMFIGFYRNTENYLQFYEGVLLAVDSMQKEGMNIKLNVYDTEQNPGSIRKFIYSEDFLKTDLIIGPVFPEVQKEVADIAAKNRIPIVSPLSAQSNDIRSNPYFYQVNPDRDFLYRKTAELIAEDYFNSNFIVFKTGNYSNTPEGKLVDLIREKLFNSGFMGRANGTRFSIYDFQNDGIFGLRRILSKDKENVIFIPSTVEGELSIGISNINNLASEFSITLIGTSRFPQYESIQIDYFHNLKLEYIAPYWTNYDNPSTINYIEKFKSNFYTEPNNFGMQGYDVTFYFLNALKNYGNDFRDCLPYLQVDLVQGNYRFEKVSQLGGYMNHGVSVISYERDYDVVRKRVEGQLNLAGN